MLSEIMDNESHLNESHSINNGLLSNMYEFENRWKALNLINSIDFIKYK